MTICWYEQGAMGTQRLILVGVMMPIRCHLSCTLKGYEISEATEG